MAHNQQSAVVYLRKTFGNLVSQMQNFPVIVENLYQRRVFNVYDVKAVKEKWREQDKARYILNRVINEGETASYELLKILDFTWKRTLRPTLHNWIKRYFFREDSETIYSSGTKPCKGYQTQLKMKAKSVLENQMEQQSTKYLLHKQQENFHFIPLASGQEYVVKNQQYKKLGAYIPNQKETVSPADLLRWMDRNILLIGKPGIGKTTIAQQMLRLWTEKNGTEPYYMFYFDENILSHSSKLMTLESLLFDVYVKAKEEYQQEVLQYMKVNAKNVVFIFDGVTHVQEDSVLKKIMNHDVLHEAKVIITYRTEMEDTHFLSDWTTKKVYVQGFTEESIRTYYQMTLGHNPDLLNMVLNNQELFSLSYVPMYAFMIANMILLKDDTVVNNPHTVTNMNIHIFFITLMKYGDKNLWEIDEYLKEIKDQLYLLMKNAFSATEQKSLNLPEISSDETNICHAFLKVIPIRDSLTSKPKYCGFLHNTMQEFFSALWLVENPDEIEKVLNLCQTEENQHMRRVLPFLCGLLGEHNHKLLKCLFSEDQMKKTSEWFIEKLLDTFLKPQSEDEDIDLLYVCQCLYELQSSNACLMFLEKMKHQLDIDVNLDPHQSCALSYVISQSRDKEVHLNLQNRTVSDTGMIMILSCSPQIRLKPWKSDFNQIKFLLQFIHKVSVNKTSMEDERMTSYCCCNSFSVYKNPTELADALLDLYSHVKDYETQSGRILLPALQLVFQSLPVVWSLDLSKRKASILLEVLKLQTGKKRLELRGWTDEKSEVVQFLHCLPYISQLGFRCFSLYEDSTKSSVIRYLLSLIVAAENKTVGEKRHSTLLSSVCSYKAFPFQCSRHVHGEYTYISHTDFLLDLCSHVKDYETQTGRSLLPALQSIFQSSPDVWIIDLSKRKTSILLEVLKLQTEKKLVVLRGCPQKESEVMSFIQCLPYISQLSFVNSDTSKQSKFLLRLFIKAAETKSFTGEQMQKLLTLVWDTSSLKHLNSEQTDFCLDLYSRAKVCETQTGRSLIPALKLVFRGLPHFWSIDLSKRKASILLEVLKLQTEKKQVELRGWRDEESEVMSFIQCLPYISQLRFYGGGNVTAEGFIACCFIKAAETERHTRDQMLKLLASVCTYRNFPYENCYHFKQSDFLLDLYSQVKVYETQTGRSLLPALKSVFQAPDVWIIDLSERKASILLEVFKLQTEKKAVKLRGCPDEESEVMSFLQCLPYISQLRFVYPDPSNATFTLRLFIKAIDSEVQTGDQMLKLLTSVCTYTFFPYENIDGTEQSDFLLNLYSHVKDYETQTGRSLLPALQSVYLAPDVWIIDVSKRKTPILLEVLKLQTEKKPVEMRGWFIESSTVMCLLKCLPYISKLRIFSHCSSLESIILKSLFVEAAETDRQSGDQTLKLLTSVCTYTSFPYENTKCSRRGHFLLDFYSDLKDYETQTGRSLLPALQSVYQTAPDVWIIDLSKRKASILLEVLKLQIEKKPIELRGWTDENTEVMSFIHCLPYISQLSGAKHCVLSLLKLAEFRQNPELVNSLLQALDFNLCLEGILPSSTCRFVGRILRLFAHKLTLTVRPQAISIRGTRLLFRHITSIQTLRLSGYMVVRTVRALRSSRVPVGVNELSVDLNDKRRSDSEMSRVLSSLASLLRLWTVQCLNLSDCRMKSLSLILLLSQQSPVTLRLPEEILQTLAECVYEAQEEELTSCFLKKMGGDLTSCSFSFKKLQYFLQHDISHVTVDLKETDMSLNIREFLPFLNRIHFQQMSSTVMMSLMREIYESRSLGFVSGLLSSVKNCINLQNRALDSVHCAFLRFILQNRTGLTLDMLLTSIPEEELESFLPLLSRVSCLSVDRVLLLRMLRCCSSSDVQQEASVVLLSALQHKLDFSCCSALDLTEDTHTQTLQLTAEDCRVMSTVIQRVYRDTQTLTQLNLHDCQINTAGIDQLFTILHSVKLQCGKSTLLQFLSHVDDGKAECLSRALGEEVDLSQTHLDLQVCRGLALVLEHSEGLTELDLSQCHLTDQSLDFLLPNLHKAQNIDFSGNSITDAGALKIMLFNNRMESRKLFLTDPRFEIW